MKQETMSSLQIAEISGKQHKDVMRSIREMEDAWHKVNGRRFALVEYTDRKGEKRPCYQLTKIECLYIATKFNDEARAKLVLRWEQLERKNTPSAPLNLPRCPKGSRRLRRGETGARCRQREEAAGHRDERRTLVNRASAIAIWLALFCKHMLKSLQYLDVNKYIRIFAAFKMSSRYDYRILARGCAYYINIFRV